MPSESGVTSSSSLIFNFAAEDARLHGRAQRDHFIGIQFRVRTCAEQHFDRVRTSGIRVDPPTITASSICSTVTPASFMQLRQGPSVRSTISARSGV